MPPLNSDEKPKGNMRVRSSSRARSTKSRANSVKRKSTASKAEFSSGDEWINTVDIEAFGKEMNVLKLELTEGQGDDDVAHYAFVRTLTEVFAVAGTIAMIFPYQWMIAPILLGIATTARWTMVGHHTLHGGYDFMNNKKFNRFNFASGTIWRRTIDWFDWMLPEAWNIEHNHLHHYQLNEKTDPDLVEDNLKLMRDLPLPFMIKKPIVMLMAAIWKWWYYAPNTFKHLIKKRNLIKLKLNTKSKNAEANAEANADANADADVGQGIWVMSSLWFVKPLHFMNVMLEAILPYAIYKFGIYPLPFLVYSIFYENNIVSDNMNIMNMNIMNMNMSVYYNALMNLFLADIVANVYSFIIIVTNHCGDDLYRFDEHAGNVTPYSGEFYLRAIIGSANFSTGTEFVDFSQGYLNYQIEHHCFPSLSMLSYKKAQPKVHNLCKKYHIPHVQENVFKRLNQLICVMVGETSMKKWPQNAPF
jgi:fatty acid desaturase